MQARDRLVARLRRWSRAAVVADAAAALLAGAGAALVARAALLAEGAAADAAPLVQVVVAQAAALALLMERRGSRSRLVARIDARHGCEGALLAIVESRESPLADALAAEVEPRLAPRALFASILGGWPAAAALAAVGGLLATVASERTRPIRDGGGAAIELHAAARGLRDAATRSERGRPVLGEAALLAERVAQALEQGDAAAAARAREDLRRVLSEAESAGGAAGNPAAPGGADERAASVQQAVAAARRAFALDPEAGAGATGSGARSGGGAARSGAADGGSGVAGLASPSADGTISTPRNAEAPPIAPAPPDLLPREDAEWIARWIARTRGDAEPRR